MPMSKNELLVISSGYPDKSYRYLAHTFVKGYVDEAKMYFDNIHVLVLTPYVHKFIKKKTYELNNYTYDNVHVKFKKYPYIPIWPFTKYRGRIAYLYLFPFALKYAKNISVIHANFTSPAGVFAYYLSKDIGKGYILTVHEDHDWLVEEEKSKNKYLINTWKHAKTIIRVNKLDNRLLKKYNKNIQTIPNGFNHRTFNLLNKSECRFKLKIEMEKKVIVNIGFYNKQKNQKLLIDAIYLLPVNIKNNLKCLIIGGGPKQKELNNYINELQMGHIIKIVGQVNHNDLPIYLNAADIFCLSSNSEGNPTVMFEALGVGVPFVGTNVGGIPEIIISEQYGLLCDPGKKEDLSEIIEKGLNKNWNRAEIINYSKQFTWENIFLKTKQYYFN